jgi:acetyltransferase-like isoleucine patch superfamily enzyme
VIARGEDAGHVGELYNNLACPQAYCPASIASATTFSTLTGSDYPGIDFVLQQQIFANIFGTMVRSADDGPIGGAAQVFDAFGNHVLDAWVDEETREWIAGPLPDGTYYVRTNYLWEGFNNDLWDGLDGSLCPALLCDVTSGDPVIVSGGFVYSGGLPVPAETTIDFRIDAIPDGTGGRITGQVVDAGDFPVNYIGVTVLNANGDYVSEVRTDPNGFYTTPLLPDGDYHLRTNYAPDGLIDELWRGFESLPSDGNLNHLCIPRWECDNPDYVVANGNIINIAGTDIATDFVLDTPDPATTATITGTIFDLYLEDGGTPEFDFPMPDVWVQLYVQNPEGFYDYYGDTVTGADGGYAFSGLPDGTYKVFAEGVPENYNAASYGDFCCDYNAEGTPIPLVAGHLFPSADIGLPWTGGSRIVGTVTRSDNDAPVASTFGWFGIDLFDDTSGGIDTRGTNVAGQFQFPVSPGSYYLATTHDVNFHGLTNEVWDDAKCYDNCDPATVTGGPANITVGDGETFLADFLLDPALVISGTVTDDGATPLPLSGIGVCAQRLEDGEWVACANTDANGEYTFRGLTPRNDYRVFVAWNNGDPWVPQDYAFNPVDITGGDATGIDFALELGFMVSGRITDSSTGLPVPPRSVAEVRLYGLDRGVLALNSVGENGEFTIVASAAGIPVYALASNYDGPLIDELWNDSVGDIYCPRASCDLAGLGTAIGTNAGDVTTGVDIEMDPGSLITGNLTLSGQTPPAGTFLFVYDATTGNYAGAGLTGRWSPTGYIDGTQAFRTGQGYPAGSYVLSNRFVSGGIDQGFNPDYVATLYLDSDPDGLECNEPCDISVGGTVVTTNGSSDTDLSANPWNWYTDTVSFSGTVASSSIGVLGDVEIQVRSTADDTIIATAYSDWDTGYWQIDGVPAGTYYVFARGEEQQHVSQLSVGVACPQTWCPSVSPSVTYDTASGDQTGIDFVLDPFATVTVSGTLLDNGDNHVGGAVRFIDPFGNEQNTAWTQNEAGEWSIDLPQGTWTLVTGFLWEGFIDDIWDGLDGAQCPALVCDFAATGTPVVTDGVNPVSGIGLRVDPLGASSRIHGHVSGPSGALNHVAVAVLNADGRYLFEMRTDPDGNYRSSPLSDGEYYLRTGSEPGGLARQLYDGVDCIPRFDCDDRSYITSLGTPIDTAAGDRFGINFVLAPLGGGHISGSVYDAGLGAGFPLPDVYLSLFDEFGNWLSDTTTDPQGNYTFAGLETGNYRVFAEGVPEGYQQECFSDVACDWDTNFSTTGTLIGIEIGATDTATADIANFAWFAVNVYDEAGNPVGGTGPNVAGQYQLYLPGNGNYRVSTNHDTDFHNLVNEAWNSTGGAQCFGDCNPLNVGGSELIDLTGGGSFTADFELDPAAEIVGTVTEEGIGTPLGGITMCLAPQVGNPWYACRDTAEDGTYAFRGLNGGSDYVPFVWNVNGQGYARETWQDKPCCDAGWIGNGDAITVALGGSVTADFALAPAAAITGLVTDSATGTPIGNVPVWLVTPACDFIERGNSDGSGRYTLSGFDPGTYYVAAQADGQGYVRQLYPDVKRYDACAPDIADGQAIPVDPLAVINNVDLALDMGGSISGYISDASGVLPQNSADVRLYDEAGNIAGFNRNREADGGYTVGGLLPGTYTVLLTGRNQGLIDERYDDVPCPRNACDPALGVPVVVTPEENVTGVDATLAPGARLSGRITDVSGPVANYFVDFYTLDGLYAGYGRTDADGNFTSVTGFPDGEYLMSNQWFPTPGNPEPVAGGYLPQVWKADGSFGECGDPCNLLLGDPITISGGADVAGLDMLFATGTRLSGAVTSGATPLAGVEMRLLSSVDGSLARSTTTDGSGNYAFDGLPSTGQYFLRTLNSAGYGDLLFDTPTDDSCNPSCDPLLGGLIAMTTDQVIDFDLVPTPVIQGQVTLPVTGNPAPGVSIKAYNNLGSVVASTLTDASGNYTLANLWSGTFYVRSHNTAGYLDDLWSNTECGAACDVLDGTPVNLTASGAAGINLQLRSAAVISGTVTDGAVPLPGVTVQLYRDTGAFVKSVISNAAGTYSLNGLSAGNYHLVTRNTFGYVDEGAGGETCQSTCAPTSTTVVNVPANASVVRNFALDYGGEISGNVQGGGSPLVGVSVRAFNSAGVQIASTTTNASGNYLIRGLVGGNVYLRTANAAPYRNQRYDGLACDTFCDVLAGTAVAVTLGGTSSGIDFVLEAGYSISGNVTNADTGSGIPGVRVDAFDGAGLLAGTAVAATGGAFEIDGLPNGDYRLKTANAFNYIDRVLGGDTCTPEPCEIGTGSLNVVSGADIGGVSIALSTGNTTGGYVTDTDSNPLQTGAAWLYSATGAFLKTAAINDGLFSFNGLADGSYRLLVKNDLGLVDQLWEGIDCPDGSCDITAGTPIDVGAAPAAPAGAPSSLESGRLKIKLESSHSGESRIRFGLPRGTRISGNVSSDAGAVQFVNVYIFDADGDVAAVAVTDGLGNFETASGLPAGNWYVATQAPGQPGAGNGLIDEVFDDLQCLGDCDPVGLGTLVSTPNPDPVNIVLTSGDEPITGTVAAASTGAALGQVAIDVFDDLGVLVKQTSTSGSGEYTVDGLPSGDYTLIARATAGNYGAILFNNLYCDGGCDPTDGLASRVQPGGIADFALPDDNCPNWDNPDQTDSDGNGRGDACELPDVSDKAEVDPSASLGVGVIVAQQAKIGANARIGNGTTVARNADIGASCRIGDFVVIAQSVQIGLSCRIGNYVRIDQGAELGNYVSVGANTHIGRDTLIGNNVTVGSDVEILRNVFIADGVCIPDGSSFGKDEVITDLNLCD